MHKLTVPKFFLSLAVENPKVVDKIFQYLKN